jgi:hypothetical protein
MGREQRAGQQQQQECDGQRGPVEEPSHVIEVLRGAQPVRQAQCEAVWPPFAALLDGLADRWQPGAARMLGNGVAQAAADRIQSERQ